MIVMIELVANASLPTKYGKFAIHGFREGGKEHVALVSGDVKDKRALVRIHSKCLTGDTFNSMRCDCNAQLRKSLELIGSNAGVLIYLDQEGRGIGLLNKLRAYELQDKGMDIAETNEHLGFGYDERDYSAAAEILKFFGLTKITLLTNNPDKMVMLERSGIDVERRPLVTQPNEHNSRYMETKRTKAGHLL
ncbi:MAG: GTP cyclohydrolase II [Candidatus Aenigmarchaeota archaeon]|nr:GTP cyclohydrolase II [Candidatus Aenigmarchaeota archaeon]